MAGSRRNPLMKDQWRADDDHIARDNLHPHPRERDRERNRERPERRPRSPPPSRRGGGRGHERPRGRGASFVSNNPSSRRPLSGRRGDHKKHHNSDHSNNINNNNRSRQLSPSSHDKIADTDQRDSTRQSEGQVNSRGDPKHSSPPQSPAPPPKRKRSRSISPSRLQPHPRPKRRDGRNPDRPERGRGRSDRNFSPRRGPIPRGKDYRPTDLRSEASATDYLQSRRRRSRSPDSFIGRRSLSPRRVSRSPPPTKGYQDHSPRPSSRHSLLSRSSRQSPQPTYRKKTDMQSTRPIQSVVDDSRRSPSPLRPIPSFDAGNPKQNTESDSRKRDTFQKHSMRGAETRGSRRPSRPQIDTRGSYSTSPQYVTPTSSHLGSPQSGSPHSGGRGSWSGQQQYHGQQGQMGSYSPPYRQATYPPPQAGPQGQYYQGQPYSASAAHGQQPGYSSQPYRAGPPGYRGTQYNPTQDRRFSVTSSQSYGNAQSPPQTQTQQQQQRGRGSHFNNLQWTPSTNRGRGAHGPPGGPLQQPHISDERLSPEIDEDDNPFRPSKDLQVEDEDSKPKPEKQDSKKMPPPNRQHSVSSQPKEKESGKFSFAFKSKAPAPATPKPVPDLARRMREPPPKAIDPLKSKQSNVPPPRDKHISRPDRKDDRRDSRRNDRRFDNRGERHRDRRDERRGEPRHERRQERSPERKKPKKILKRMKPRPSISEEFSKSDSVYYRKPGNESVIGAGTYGKVFKAIHVYTKNMVALKKIRMETEKDGFPVTAVREIRLLQHLRHENVVSLQEVMVEKNECFMVFEYLSHDLTGLINHPTFSLSAAHKKHLARQMFDGLNYLHHRGVLHRDIKAANILISNQGQLKFADFGLARFFSKSRQLDYTNRVITIWYRPPELLLGETRYGPAVDIWSAACVWMEMFTKKAVFPGEGGEISQLEKLYNSLGTPTRADWPDIVEMPWFELLRPTERKPRTFEDAYRDVLSPAALDLVAKMFQYDPVKRPSAEEVLTHPYFTTEEPAPQQAIELASVEGDWHEFESKAHRKEKDKEARRAEYQREKEKRRVSGGAIQNSDGRDTKRARLEEDISSQLPSLEN
ncbi:latrunculin sensitive kinase Lsk1 [Histoplasma capsulatum var. duboisii H88]|uniref:cyclin-dependent kinase n=1 Tax=Ajellomyces capsulatus (strain H88) TaxID=544711 RepID=A0A8A1LI43_AJEC8|nr:latrunculin sensitive kinase Lsk1 [Histoplasma capsulatum var. duboisii H88]